QAAEQVRPAEAAVLDDALKRLELERSSLAHQVETLREREEEIVRLERRRASEATRQREQAESERGRIREEMQTLIADTRRQGEDVLRELRSGGKTRRDLSAFVRQSSTRLEEAAPTEQPPSEEGPTGVLKVGDQVELTGSDIRGELLVLES